MNIRFFESCFKNHWAMVYKGLILWLLACKILPFCRQQSAQCVLISCLGCSVAKSTTCLLAIFIFSESNFTFVRTLVYSKTVDNDDIIVGLLATTFLLRLQTTRDWIVVRIVCKVWHDERAVVHTGPGPDTAWRARLTGGSFTTVMD